MSEKTEIEQSQGRLPVEEQLQLLLDRGSVALRDQLRLLLMASQVKGGQAQYIPYPSQVYTVRAARLQTLTRMSDTFSTEQIHHLLKDVRLMGHGSIRLNLLIALLPRLPQPEAQELLREIWRQSATIIDPVARSQILFQLAPHVAQEAAIERRPSVLMQVLDVVLHLESLEARVRGIAALAPYLPEEIYAAKLRQLLNVLQATHNDSLIGRALLALAHHIPADMHEIARQTAAIIKEKGERARALTILARYMPVQRYPQLHRDALETIAELPEDERADALTAFAPNLESAVSDRAYPELLEQALAIAISIPQRPLRARVLVALAVHLTDDLQREALAAVRSLSSERERALLLQSLIPTLPQALLHEVLVMGEMMQEADYRAQVLCSLVQALPDDERQPIIDTTLETARHLPNRFERVRTLVELLPLLDPQKQVATLQTALETAAQFDNPHTLARVLGLIGSYLDEELMRQALSLAYTIDNPQYRLNALLGLIPHLQGRRSEVAREMMTCAHQISLPYKRAAALISMLPYLTQGQVLQALALVDVLTDPLDEVYVYVTAAQHLSPQRRQPLMERIIQKLDGIKDGYNRASAMMMIAPHLHDAAERFKPLILETIQRDADDYDRASTITMIAPLLEGDAPLQRITMPSQQAMLRTGLDIALQIPQQDLRVDVLREGIHLWLDAATPENSFDLWRELAPRLMTMPLADVLMCLEALLPLFEHFYGAKARQIIAYLLGMR